MAEKWGRRFVSMGCALALLLSAAVIAPFPASAQWRPGTAPYINTWLVAGPANHSISQSIYSQTGEELPNVEKLVVSSVTASTSLSGTTPQMAVDGSLETAWKSDTRQGIVWDSKLTLTLTLEDISQVSSLKLNGFERDNKPFSVKCSFKDKDGLPLLSTFVERLDTNELTVKLGNVQNVKTVELKIEELTAAEGRAPNHLGFREVEVYGLPGEVEPLPKPQINPVQGETFGDSQTDWQYFDDRIFNRNTDDYQDLYGYFNVKQGLELAGQYVYAHTYIYSEQAQPAQLRFVTTGLHRVYVNDVLIEENAFAVESSNKDNYIRNFNLKQGWNKLLIEIKQTRVHYLGFYARVTSQANGTDANSNGDRLDGLTFSVSGPGSASLSIVTQGLSIDRTAFEARNASIPANVYPENELPCGYTEWPYVWNKAVFKTTQSYAPQASKFQFQAAGGKPGYRWELVAGRLPDGLTMDADGNVDGFCTAEGAYTFTLQVTDADNGTATKETKIIVKARPSKWFEEGKMSALSHNTGAYTQFFDPNYSFDLWAERAKDAGITMLSTEAVQGVYYWPAPGAFPGDPTGAAALQHPYTTEVVDGIRQPKDMVKLAKEAAERHGLRFGLYYASEGSNRIVDSRVNSSSGFFVNVEDLVKRYDPSYLFFDGGPQGKGNIDAMWSAVRAYNDHALIQANDQNEVSDNDITILESEYTGAEPYTYGGYWETNMLMQNKYTVEEVWSHPFIKELGVWAQYAGGHMRDDWRLWAEFIVNNIGHGFVANYDQMIVSCRGVNWNGRDYNSGMTKDLYYNYPLNAQRFIELRDNVNQWMSNGSKPDLRESLFGTMPYYFDTYVRQSGDHDNTAKEPFLTAKYGEGPEWGYPVGRDQYVYMHMVENTIGMGRAKKGFTGQESMVVGPFGYNVTGVEWLNEGRVLPYVMSETDGKKYITIDTSSVKADPVDTILKITTDAPARAFQLTSVKLFSDQTRPAELQLRAEAYLKSFTSLLSDAALTYSSDDESVASVDQSGLVKAVGAGKTTIRVSAAYEGATASDSYAVQVKADGSISPDLELIGVVLRTDGKEAFGSFPSDSSLPVTFEGRTQKGGGINILQYDSITWHYGVCSGVTSGTPSDPDGYWHAREVSEPGTLTIADNKISFKGVAMEQNLAIWADITIDGRTYTTNMNYLRVYPEQLLSAGAAVEVTSGESASALTDGVINSADGGNTAKWTPDNDDAVPGIVLNLNSYCDVKDVSVYYNNKDRFYRNTPRSISIEISGDGATWETAVIGGPVPNASTKYCYEDDVYTYPIAQRGRYVRLTFPGGALGDSMDVLEVKVRGADLANTLTELVLTPQISGDRKTMTLGVTGLSGTREELDMSGAAITVVSDNPAVAAAEGSVLKAVAPGRARIAVTAVLNGSVATDELYVDVDRLGRFGLRDYLTEVNLALNQSSVGYDAPVVADIGAVMKSGASANLSAAEVAYVFGDDRLSVVDGSSVIYLKEQLSRGLNTTVAVRVTLDGVVVESKPVPLTILGSNLAGTAKVTVSSVRDRNGVPDGNAIDDRYLGEKAIDGDRVSSWAAKKVDESPWIRLDFNEPVQIGKVNLIDRGHEVNLINEGLLAWEGGSQVVKNIKWVGRPDNFVSFEAPVTSSWISFTIDPDETYVNPADAECGLGEFEVFAAPAAESWIVGYKTIAVSTAVGVVPSLPAQAEAVHNNCATVPVDVTWDVVSDEMVAAPGVLTVRGTVAGTAVPVKATVYVGAAEPDALAVSVTTPSIVASLKAYLNIRAEGDASADGNLTACLDVNGDLLYPTPIVGGTGRMTVEQAPAAATYRLVVISESGEERGGCDIFVKPYSTDIWSAAAYALDGMLYLRFNEDLTLKAAADCVTIGGMTYSASVMSDRRTVEVLGCDVSSLPPGSTISVKGVKFPALFPSYSFTFTVAMAG